MHRLFVTLLVVVGTLVAIGAGQAGTPPVTFTDTFKDTETFTDVVPCQESLGAYDITVVENGVIHITAAAIDEEENLTPPYHITGTFTGTFEAVPSDGTGPTFSGRFTQWFGENSNNSTANGTFTFSVRGTGSDGSSIRFNVVAHFGVSATGATLEFEKANCH